MCQMHFSHQISKIVEAEVFHFICGILKHVMGESKNIDQHLWKNKKVILLHKICLLGKLVEPTQRLNMFLAQED